MCLLEESLSPLPFAAVRRFNSHSHLNHSIYKYIWSNERQSVYPTLETTFNSAIIKKEEEKVRRGNVLNL